MKYKVFLIITIITISHLSISQVSDFHIEGENPILTIEANSSNPKLQLTDNFASTTDDWVMLYDVNDAGQLKWRYSNMSNMTLNTVGNLGLGTTIPEVKFHIKGGPDATMSAGTGFIQLGNTDGVNLIMDNNEIMARDNGSTTSLGLNLDGGEVHFGRTATPANIRVRGTIRSTALESSGYKNVVADGNGELKIDSQIKYLSLPATAFHPDVDINSVDWYSTPASTFFNQAPSSLISLTAPVILPHNSTITRVTVYYSDTDNVNHVQFWLRRYDNTDPFTLTKLAEMTSADGNHQVVTTSTNILVDNSASAFSFKMQPTSGGYMDNSFKLHHVVIEYQ